MDIVVCSGRGRYAAKACIFFIAVALVGGMVGCVSSPTEYRLTISSTEGGDVTTPGEGTSAYDEGEVVELVAEAREGYRFVNWTGDVDDVANVEDPTTTITMEGDYSLTASFEEVALYHLTVSSTEGGSVTTPGEGTFPYDGGQAVNLVATPDAGWQFLNWTGDVDDVANVEDATTTITMSRDCSITANFGQGGAVTFADPNLETAIREAIRIPERPIYPSDLRGITSFSASGRNISNLTGLEHCINLTHLDLSHNQIGNISPVGNLTNLAYLELDLNGISNISPLVQNGGLGEGDAVYLRGNPLSWN